MMAQKMKEYKQHEKVRQSLIQEKRDFIKSQQNKQILIFYAGGKTSIKNFIKNNQMIEEKKEDKENKQKDIFIQRIMYKDSQFFNYSTKSIVSEKSSYQKHFIKRSSTRRKTTKMVKNG